MRRSGKSLRLLQEMVRLHEKGAPWSRICYFNFEDDRLGAVTPKTGDAVIESFKDLHPESADEGIYCFFDEIQEMDGWSAWMRRMVDTQKATFCLTGSSSKLLSDEIGSEFRGRAVYLELRRRMTGLRENAISSYRADRHGYEVDFLTGDSVLGEAPALYQVCASLEASETRERELRALAEAAEETGIEDRFLILGAGEGEEAVVDGRRIHIVPAIEWFLG